MVRLSIIVPIYNVEHYIEKCLRSLEEQDIPTNDYEIICINDGSPDGSREIVLKLQNEFDNIILIDQENQGVSIARNNGMDIAKGKYFISIDPDDFVNTNCFSRILNIADEHRCQVLFLGYTILNKDGEIRKVLSYEENKDKVFLGTEAYYIPRVSGQNDPDRLVGVIFEADFMNRNNLRYLPGIPYLEDGEFIARILCLAQSCIFDDHSFYQRTTRAGSATNSNLYYSKKAANGFLMAAISLKRFQEEQKLNEKQRIFLNQPICKFTFLASTGIWRKPYFKNYIKMREKKNNYHLRKLEIMGVAKPYRYYVPLYNISLIAFYFFAGNKFINFIFRIIFGSSKYNI